MNETGVAMNDIETAMRMGAQAGPLLAAIALLLAVVMTFLWRRATSRGEVLTGKLGEMDEELARARADLEKQVGAGNQRVGQLERALNSARQRQYLEEFQADLLYTIVVQHSVEVDGQPHTLGLVRDEAGRVQPFLTGRSMESLAPGDTFSIVRGRLLKSQDASAPPPSHSPAPPPLDTTVPLGFSTATPVVADDSEATLMEPAGAVDEEATMMAMPSRTTRGEDPEKFLPYLEVLGEAARGKRFPLSFAATTLGRGETSNVVLDDQRASRVNTEVRFENNVFHVVDRNSTNGTWHNGERISRAVLDFGDTIRVGDTELRYSCPGFDLKNQDAGAAITAFEGLVALEGRFVTALKNLAFLLERDVARNKEAAPLWQRVLTLEKGGTG